MIELDSYNRCMEAWQQAREEISRLNQIIEDLKPRNPKYRELCWYHDVCQLPIGHVGDHHPDPAAALLSEQTAIELLKVYPGCSDEKKLLDWEEEVAVFFG